MLQYNSHSKKVRLVPSENGKWIDVSISPQGDVEDFHLIASFDINSVWDMLKTELINSTVPADDLSGIPRRRNEAVAANLFTQAMLRTYE